MPFLFNLDSEARIILGNPYGIVVWVNRLDPVAGEIVACFENICFLISGTDVYYVGSPCFSGNICPDFRSGQCSLKKLM